MLVIARKCGETVEIGDDIAVTVVDIDRGKIRLGIRAPKHTGVWRSELVERGKLTGRLPPAVRTEDGPRDDMNVDSFYDDGILGGSN